MCTKNSRNGDAICAIYTFCVAFLLFVAVVFVIIPLLATWLINLNPFDYSYCARVYDVHMTPNTAPTFQKGITHEIYMCWRISTRRHRVFLLWLCERKRSSDGIKRAASHKKKTCRGTKSCHVLSNILRGERRNGSDTNLLRIVPHIPAVAANGSVGSYARVFDGQTLCEYSADAILYGRGDIFQYMQSEITFFIILKGFSVAILMYQRP